jgi:hypothetical protein
MQESSFPAAASGRLGRVDRLCGVLLDRRGWPWAFLVIGLAWLVFSLPWLAFGQVIPWDSKDYYYPVLRALAATLHAGDSGLWNPWLRGGSAVVADPQSWLFTPTFRMLAYLDAAPSMHLVDAFELAHLLVGGAGILLLARRWRQKPVSGLIAALVFMFAGAAASRLQHTMMIVSYAYLSWSLLLLDIAFTAKTTMRRTIAAAGFGLVAGLMAVDRDQVAFLNALFLLLAAAIGLGLAWRRKGFAAMRGHVLELIPALVVGLILLGIPALLTLDMLPDSTRAGLDYSTTSEASLHPATLLTLIAPDFFGGLGSNAYWGPGEDPWEAFSKLAMSNDPTTSQLYIGALPFAFLALALVIPAIRRRFFARPEAVVVGAGTAFALSYVLGGFTPLFRLMYDFLPGVDLYRRPNDAAFLLNAMLALLAGVAVEAVVDTPRREVSLPALGRAALPAGAGLVIAAGLSLAWWFGHLATAALALAAGLALLAASIALVRFRPVAMGAGVWAAVVVALAAGDLAVHYSGSPDVNAAPESDIAAYRPEGVELAAAIKSILSEDGGHYRAEIFGLDAVPGRDGGGSWQNAALVYGIEQTLGYDPLLTNEYANAVGADQNSNLPTRRFTDLFTGYDSTLARLLGIRLVVTGRPIEEICTPRIAKGLEFIGMRQGAYLYLNPKALPRVMLVPHAIADAGGPLPRDPESEVMIAGLKLGETGHPAYGPIGKADIASYRSDAVSVEVQLDRPGWLVLNDLYHPAWQATIDGHGAAIRRANRLFRAVFVPAGEHRVDFSFQPLSPDQLWDSAAARFSKARRRS